MRVSVLKHQFYIIFALNGTNYINCDVEFAPISVRSVPFVNDIAFATVFVALSKL